MEFEELQVKLLRADFQLKQPTLLQLVELMALTENLEAIMLLIVRVILMGLNALVLLSMIL
jgi:hypothetical protein